MVAKPKPKPVPAGYHPVKIPNPAVDPDFMYQHADLVNQQNQFRTGQQHAASQYTTNNNQALGAIGYDTAKQKFNPLNTTPGTYGAAKRDVLDDFAGRGMAYSTPYQTATANMDNDYKHRRDALINGANQFAQTQGDQTAQNRSSIVSADAANRRHAIARIAGKYGVQTNQIPRAGGTVNVRNP